MKLDEFNRHYSSLKSQELHGRFITNSDIEKCLKLHPDALVKVEGFSVEDRPIYSIKIGTGDKKILMWSQMHGNESTTTKALFDLFNYLYKDNEASDKLLKSCTLLVIPILNPDGAERYTRLNANDVDLNRDAQDLSQPESIVLRKVFDSFKPDFCFNLHGQRTIYNVGDTSKSSIISFLSPSQDKSRSLTSSRKKAMAIISLMNRRLQLEIPRCIARYDDAFNINCVGDTFQSSGVPTILFEAGHFPNDYKREEVRRLMCISILEAINTINSDSKMVDFEDYLKIPENSKLFYDIIIRNARLNDNAEKVIDIAILYREELKDKKVDFVPVIKSISNLESFYGHREIDAKGEIIHMKENSELKVGYEIDFVLINNERISLKPSF